MKYRSIGIGTVVTACIWLALTSSSLGLTSTTTVAQPNTLILGVLGNQFTVDTGSGPQPKFLLFVSYFDALRREAAGGVDADFAYIAASGYHGVRILPNWWHYSPGNVLPADDDALFTTGGDLRSSSLTLLKSVLDKARAHGLLVDVSFTAETYGVPNPDAAFLEDVHKPQLIDITNELKLNGAGYRHVFFDVQNEWPNTIGNEPEIPALIQAVRDADPARLVTISTGGDCRTNYLQCDPGPWSTTFGLDINAFHDDRSTDDEFTDWYQDAKLQQEIGVVRQAIDASVDPDRITMPIHLQEPKAIAPFCATCGGQTDTTPAHAYEAARAAKRYAAGWTFHTRSAFDLSVTGFRDRLVANEADPTWQSTEREIFEALPVHPDGPNGVAARAPDAPINVTGVPGDGQVTVSFKPVHNGWAPITGYTVTASPGGNTNSGNSTTLTVTGLTNGTAYTFTVTATNSIPATSDPSDPSPPVTPTVAPPGSFGKTLPGFGAAGVPLSPTLSWAASSGAISYEYCIDTSNNSACNTSWVNVGNATSAPAGVLPASTTHYWQVRANNAGGTTYANGSPSLFRPFTTGVASGPFGQVDTPAQDAAGVQGAINVTGWVLDDIDVTKVEIFRNCLGFEPANCQTVLGQSVVYIGDAAFVPGARPDVAAAYPTHPFNNEAGFGYQILTLMLPHVTNSQPYGGQGPITIYAIATDSNGNKKILGRSTADSTPTSMTMANDSIAKPFGTIDTPGQGQTISGTFNNFGWVLTPDSNTTGGEGGDILMPTTGSTMFVFIDGLPVSTVAYNQCRGTVGNPPPGGVFCNDDVSNIFGNTTAQPPLTTRTSNPTKYRNLDAGRGAIGAYTFDTNTLSNGLHTIAWSVTDSLGRAEGIGSRHFTVDNGGTQSLSAASAASSVITQQAKALGEKSQLDRLTPVTEGVRGRTGFSLAASWAKMHANDDGTYAVRLPESGRLELWLGPVEAGYLVANDKLWGLPVGSTLLDSGFAWMPPPGYVGPYRLTFVRGGKRIDVTVTVVEKPRAVEAEAQVRVHLNAAVLGTTDECDSLAERGVRVDGWAFDPQAAIGSGIGAVRVWAIRNDAGVGAPLPFLLGSAPLEQARPDGPRSQDGAPGQAGFSLTALLAPGRYVLTAHVWIERTGRWEDARSVHVVVR